MLQRVKGNVFKGAMHILLTFTDVKHPKGKSVFASCDEKWRRSVKSYDATLNAVGEGNRRNIKSCDKHGHSPVSEQKMLGWSACRIAKRKTGRKICATDRLNYFGRNRSAAKAGNSWRNPSTPHLLLFHQHCCYVVTLFSVCITLQSKFLENLSASFKRARQWRCWIELGQNAPLTTSDELWRKFGCVHFAFQCFQYGDSGTCEYCFVILYVYYVLT